MDQETMNRLRSPVAWGTLVNLVVFVVLLATGQDISETAMKIYTLVTAALTAFGIWNNPTSKTSI